MGQISLVFIQVLVAETVLPISIRFLLHTLDNHLVFKTQASVPPRFGTVQSYLSMLYAAAALTMPNPVSAFRPGMLSRSADARMVLLICAGVSCGKALSSSAAMSAAIGAAADVPSSKGLTDVPPGRPGPKFPK